MQLSAWKSLAFVNESLWIHKTEWAHLGLISPIKVKLWSVRVWVFLLLLLLLLLLPMFSIRLYTGGCNAARVWVLVPLLGFTLVEIHWFHFLFFWGFFSDNQTTQWHSTATNWFGVKNFPFFLLSLSFFYLSSNLIWLNIAFQFCTPFFNYAV